MKNLLQNIISKLCFVSFLGIVVSCTTDDFSENRHYDASEVGGDVNLSLNVSIAGTSDIRQTRDGEESEDNRFKFEETENKFELINTLRIIIVRPDYTVEVNQFIDFKNNAVSKIDRNILHANGYSEDDLKFRLSTTQGRVNNEAMTCTERKRVYLIANEATLGNTDFKSNFTGESQKIPDLLKELTPAYYPNKEEEKNGAVGNIGSKLDPYKVERWLIYNEWPESGDPGTNVNDLLALPIIDNDVPEGTKKSYIPMTEFFDIDVVSTWDPKKTGSGSASGSGNGSGSGGSGNQVINNDGGPIAIPEQTADLFVTRNFVKFQFSAWSETEKFKIVELRFENVMQKEYLFPFATIYSPGKYVDNNPGIIFNPEKQEREIISFQTPGLAGNNNSPYLFKPGNNLDFTPPTPTDVDPGMIVSTPVTYMPELYFCETQNYVSDTNHTPLYRLGAKIKYRKADGNDETVTYESVKLDNLPYSLPRNTIVRIDLTIRDRKLNAVATVYPYTAVSLNPEFGFSRPATDKLTIAPTLELTMGGDKALVYPTYKSENDIKIDNLIWVCANAPDETDIEPVILLEPKDNDYEPNDLLYVQPSDSIELPFGEADAEGRGTPVRVVPKRPGKAILTVYSQTGLVAQCIVTVK